MMETEEEEEEEEDEEEEEEVAVDGNIKHSEMHPVTILIRPSSQIMMTMRAIVWLQHSDDQIESGSPFRMSARIITFWIPELFWQDYIITIVFLPHPLIGIPDFFPPETEDEEKKRIAPCMIRCFVCWEGK